MTTDAFDYEITLTCGDTMSTNVAPVIGAYRKCIHCDSRKRVIAIYDRRYVQHCCGNLVVPVPGTPAKCPTCGTTYAVAEIDMAEIPGPRVSNSAEHA